MADRASVKSVGRNWLVLLALSAAFVGILELVAIPAALLLGPMLAAIALSSRGLTVTLPEPLSIAAQGVIGCMIAAALPLAMLGEIARDWPIFIGGVVAVILAAATLGWMLAWLRVLPGTTAIWGSMPGAATAMTIMSASFGADMRLVAFMQFLRLVCVSIIASVVARIWVGHTGAVHAPVDWFPPLDWISMMAIFGLIAASYAITWIIRLPAGIFLLPMVGGMLLQGLGILTLHLPPWLLACSYALVGWNIGRRFDREILGHAAKALPRVLASILLLIAICGLFAVALVKLAGVDPLTAYLATSPGGADSVAIISAASHVDVPFVMAMQMSRFLMILVTGPAIARLVVRMSGIVDEPPKA